MNKNNIGIPIKTHEHLQHMVKNKKWIVIRVNNYYKSWVAAAFVNRQYRDVCNILKNNSIFEYKKNK